MAPAASGNQDNSERVRVVILGATGSVGTTALKVIKSNPAKFELLALAAGHDHQKLLDQAIEFKPRFAALYEDFPADYAAHLGAPRTEFMSGPGAIDELAAHPDADVILAAISGVAGLRPVMRALAAGKLVALANKESLVAAGSLMTGLCASGNGKLLPVDSEHSAIFQLLHEGAAGPIDRIYLTASGGPFLNKTAAELKDVTPAQAAAHPRWNMGAKISIDSATMMNKALELIEAHWLFGISGEKIDILIHPQSIVHSLVGFVDGSQFAQLSIPDMSGPIAYALNYPHGRLEGVMETLDLTRSGALEFFKLDDARFPAVRLARTCLQAGGSAPALFNLANEIAVRRFREGRLSFDRVVPFTERALEVLDFPKYTTLDDLFGVMQSSERTLENL